MPELLLELGCEELPATFVEKAYEDLRDKIVEALSAANVMGPDSKAVAMGTPRRLIVSISNLIEKQADEQKEMRGPAIQAAFDADGNPTKALEGFCRSNGVDVATVRKDDKYVWIDKSIVGRETNEVLQEVLPQAIKSLTFEKTMRWGSARMRFARPIRWILAAFDGSVVPFVVESVQSTLASQGHRFYSPDLFEAKSLASLVEGLRARSVEPDAEIRRHRIRQGAREVATGEPLLTEALVDENAFLTEWPTPIQGEFKPEFLDLPRPVLITAMAKHEKMFPVQDADGKLTNRFVFVRNSGQDETVRIGNQWVLNARFNDARFFYAEDSKHSMDQFLEKTSTIVFQEKLGNVRQRAERLSKLAEKIAEATGGGKEDQVLARTAGLYCKADLATGLVSELPALQGVIGSEYAKREGMLEDVAWAISSHYDLSKNQNINASGAKTAVRVAMADQLDKLAGYLGLGLEPSGSKDPFGLRRAATVLIEASLMWSTPLPSFTELLSYAISLYKDQGVEVDEAAAQPALVTIFASRYEALLSSVRYDILAASLLDSAPAETCMPRRIRLRIKCLEGLAKEPAFVQTATRPMNIVASARRNKEEFAEENPLAAINPDALQSETGFTLLQALKMREDEVHKAVEEERAEDIISLSRALERPINDFFEATMIMAEEPEVRFARLSLANACAIQLLAAGDFSKLVVAGAEVEAS
jgi:glycyl-tRNA synthetase beta chain